MKDNTEDIENYLNELLNAEELAAFEARLSVDEALSEEVNLHKQLRSFIKETEVTNLKADVKNYLATENEETTIVPTFKQTSNFSIGFLSKIAAGIVIVAGLSWYFFSNKTTQSPENEYFTMLENQAPAQLQDISDRSEWVQNFKEKNFEAVVAGLEAKQDKTAEELYYFGLALAAKGSYEKAISPLDQKIVAESAFSEKAEWAKAIIYLKAKKPILAEPLLKKIAQSNSEFNVAAKKILAQ
jgi:hypothetical protein